MRWHQWLESCEKGEGVIIIVRQAGSWNLSPTGGWSKRAGSEASGHKLHLTWLTSNSMDWRSHLKAPPKEEKISHAAAVLDVERNLPHTLVSHSKWIGIATRKRVQRTCPHWLPCEHLEMSQVLSWIWIYAGWICCLNPLIHLLLLLDNLMQILLSTYFIWGQRK